MGYTIHVFIEEIASVISEVEQEYLARKNGIVGNGNEQQLKSIIAELKQIKHQAETNMLPIKGERFTAFSRYIIDGWNFDSELGIKLLNLGEKYVKKI